MSVQTQDIKPPVHRVPAIIAFVLAGIFLALALAGAPAFYVFGAFSALCGLIWALGGGANGAQSGTSVDGASLLESHSSRSNDPQLFGYDYGSQIVYGRPGDEWSR